MFDYIFAYMYDLGRNTSFILAVHAVNYHQLLACKDQKSEAYAKYDN